MAQGLRIALPYSSDPDPTLPYAGSLHPDARPGSLAIHDFAYPTAPLEVALANGQSLVNWAWPELAERLGSGTETSLKSAVASQNIAGDAGLSELTAAGCPHVIVSQANHVALTYLKIVLADAARQDILDNLTDLYRVTMHLRVTRTADPAPALSDHIKPPKLVIQNSAGLPNNILVYINSAASYPLAGNRVAAVADPGYDTADAEAFVSATVNGFTGTAPANLAAMIAEFGWGQLSGYGGSTWYNQCGSHVLRYVGIENLTKSGFTTDDVAALDVADKAAWAARCAAGGLYAGDLPPTDPDTLP